MTFLVKTKNVQNENAKVFFPYRFLVKKIWRNIIEEYIKHFGFSDSIKRIDELECKIAIYKIERLANDDRTVNALINIAEKELEEIEAQNKLNKTNIYHMKGVLDRAGFNIDAKSTSTFEFYTHYFILKEENGRGKNK